MTMHLRKWVDYDRTSLSGLTAAERVDYFEARVRMVAINPLRRILDREIHVSADSSALLIYGVGLCCAIEATGKFMTPKGTFSSRRFHTFLSNYMSPDFQSGTVGQLTYAECLWQHFRNGLAHGFTVRHGGFERDWGQSYFEVKKVAGHQVLSLNPFLLYDDYVSGFERYLRDLRADLPSGQRFRKFTDCFEAVFAKGEKY